MSHQRDIALSGRLLLVEDDKSLLRLLTIRLQAQGLEVVAVEDGQSALRKIQQGPFDIVLTDLRMPGLDGLELFEQIIALRPETPVVLMTAHGTIADAVTATQRGVFGFLAKPIDHAALREVLERALQQTRAGQSDDWCADIITRAPEMRTLLEQAYRIAPLDVSILITGGSGTGKELLAKAIHKASTRRDKPFVAINCGALPENLLESELFGHVKGAFTGAASAHMGLFREADGGTLFLDEIGDMPLPLQVKLLRALQEQQIRPVGSSKTIDINVRILSATHKHLGDEMQQGSFREDLYYRLNVVNLHLPSLKERSEDIPLLARRLLQHISERHGVEVTQFSNDAMQHLVTADWPGNVRQLVNVVERCVALSNTPVIPRHLVEQALSASRDSWPTLTEARDAFEQKYLVKLLRMTEGNMTRASELAGRNRTDLYKLLKKHSIDASEYRSE